MIRFLIYPKSNIYRENQLQGTLRVCVLNVFSLVYKNSQCKSKIDFFVVYQLFHFDKYNYSNSKQIQMFLSCKTGNVFWPKRSVGTQRSVGQEVSWGPPFYAPTEPSAAGARRVVTSVRVQALPAEGRQGPSATKISKKNTTPGIDKFNYTHT